MTEKKRFVDVHRFIEIGGKEKFCITRDGTKHLLFCSHDFQQIVNELDNNHTRIMSLVGGWNGEKEQILKKLEERNEHLKRFKGYLIHSGNRDGPSFGGKEVRFKDKKVADCFLDRFLKKFPETIAWGCHVEPFEHMKIRPFTKTEEKELFTSMNALDCLDED